MKIVSPHGAGKDVDPDGIRMERTPADEQPFPDAARPDPIAEGRDPITKRVRTREAATALAKLPRRRDILPAPLACHPGFAPHYRARLEWRDKRRAELVAVGRGVLSHGVGARLDRAAWLFAGSAFASELASKSGDVAMFATAGALAAQGDRLDWSAFHLAVREGSLRPLTGAQLPAWMQVVDPDPKGGRK